MTQVFHPATNTLSRVSLLGAVLLAAGFLTRGWVPVYQ